MPLVCTIRPHAQSIFPVSHFDHWNEQKAHMLQNGFRNCFAKRCIVIIGICQCSPPATNKLSDVFAMDAGNVPAVRVLTTKTRWFRSRPIQNLTRVSLGVQIQTHRRDLTGFASFCKTHLFQFLVLVFGVIYFWLNSNILLLIAKLRLWFVIVLFWCIGRLYNPKQLKHTPCPIMKIKVNGAWSILVLHHRQSEWQLDANVYKWGKVHIFNQKRKGHAPCPILKISVNGASILCGQASWKICMAIGCRYSGTIYRLPL